MSAVSPSTWIRPAYSMMRRMRRWANMARRQGEASQAGDSTAEAAPCATAAVPWATCLSTPSSVPFIRPSQLEMSLLAKLPTELVMKIICFLDWRSLLACRQVCIVFNTVITTSIECQYILELAIAGMEDGPSSTLALTDRLQLLREHQQAWRSLRWKSEKTLPMLDGGVWELYGGVLARARGRDTLVFTRLPAEIRGISEKQWELTPDGIQTIRDFAMEPAYDLLVLIEETSTVTYRIHLRCMNTGKPHPQACSPAVLTHSPQGVQFSFAIQVFKEYFGVLFISSDERESQLLIWNWQTGVCEMALQGQEIGSFGFLADDRVLVGVVRNPEPSLVVVNYKSVSSEVTNIADVEYELALQYPTLQPWATALAISVRSDPSPAWRPTADLKVPFHTAENERLFVITLWVAEGANIYTLLLFVPFSTVVSRLSSLSACGRARQIPWDEWGPTGSRMLQAPPGHSMIWVCYIFGMSFIAPQRTNDIQDHPVGPKAVQIFDFNQVALKRELSQPDGFDCEVTRPILLPTELHLDQIFESTVATCLPYRWKTVNVPLHPNHAFNAVMLNEDSIVTVTSNPNVREYRILSF